MTDRRAFLKQILGAGASIVVAPVVKRSQSFSKNGLKNNPQLNKIHLDQRTFAPILEAL